MTAIIGLKSLFRELEHAFGQSRHVQYLGASDSQIQLVTAAMSLRPIQNQVLRADAPRNIVIVLPSQKEFANWLGFLDYAVPSLVTGDWCIEASVLPYTPLWGTDRFVNPTLAQKQRLASLNSLDDPNVAAIVVTTFQALAQKTLAPSMMSAHAIELRKGAEVDPDELASRLRDIGYHQEESVDEEGCFAMRGGIFDIYAPNLGLPLRLEFFGDEIASIRQFSPDTQRSITARDSAKVMAAREWLIPLSTRREDAQKLYECLLEMEIDRHDREGMVDTFGKGLLFPGFSMFAPLFRPEEGTGFDYLGADDLLVFPGAIEPCLAKLEEFLAASRTDAENDRKARRASLAPERHFASPEEVSARTARHPRVLEMGNPFSAPDAVSLHQRARATFAGAPSGMTKSADLFDHWVKAIEKVLELEEGLVAILAHNDDQMARIKNLLAHRDLGPVESATLLQDLCQSKLEAGRIYVGRGDLQSHLWLEESATLVLPEHGLFGAAKKATKPASAKLQNYLSSFKDLKQGSLVVHVDHGIGRYLGMTSLDVSGNPADFLILEYGGGDKLYLPVDRLNLLQRYTTGADAKTAPQLDRLKGQNWETRKTRVRKAVRDMTERLLKLQAERQIAQSYVYSAPGDLYYKFESEFPYDETEDQSKAIAEVNADLSSAKPMDRLICGDVGYGKTEVALRAAMRVVLDGFQVLVLVPTTVLCYQHYRTFSERLGKFGVKVGQVNRFVKPAEIKETLAEVKAGKVDVLVGTHRLLSKDVEPRRLGLLVVDEEQRFGVVHKEKIKELKAGCDVLTLTATPIPRTLHMAMLGLRDISIIATPPSERLSVKTYIAKFDEELIRQAIEHEVKRGGQVFFVHNRVEDIVEICNFVRSLVPHAEARIAHGQMTEHQLEKVILDFIEQRFPILVCTTIIESGIDMPNVNTLIVNRADRFGLAQLYQMRGRVGRSSRQSYAYFFTQGEERLSPEAAKRLEILAAHQELGAGFQIASYDLELRGAGTLLGGEQSGRVADVGFELYTSMIEEAILEARGREVQAAIDTEIKIPVSATMPHDYVTSESQRLHLYKSLFSAANGEEITGLEQEVRDRYGEMPPECRRIFTVARLKKLLSVCRAASLAVGPRGTYEIKFGSLREAQIDKIIRVTEQQPRKYRLSPDYRLFLTLGSPDETARLAQDELLDRLLGLIDPLAQSLEEVVNE